MKKLIFILMLVSTQSVFSQNYVFDSFGFYIARTNNVYVLNKQFSVANWGNDNYKLNFSFPKNFNSYSEENYELKVKLRPGKKSKPEMYIYQGKLSLNNIEYGCVISVSIPLSDFTKGIGNNDNFFFDSKYKIEILYSIDDSNNSTTNLTLYPIHIEKDKD